MRVYYCLALPRKRRNLNHEKMEKNENTWSMYFSASGTNTTLDQKPGEENIQKEKRFEDGISTRDTTPISLSPGQAAPSQNDDGFKSEVDFYAFFQEFLYMKQVRICTSTLKLYYVELAKMRRFRECLTFSEINLDLIIQYENYMLTQLKNKRNTVSKSLRKIKTVIRFAILKGLLNKDPFAGYRLTNDRYNRQYLNERELASLIQLLETNLSLSEKTVLRGFIFSCYTGLRFQDIVKIGPSNIKDKMIEIKQQKTQENISIPIIEKAMPLLKCKSKGSFFPIPRNDVANRQLKLLCLRAGIKKHVTFHIARHTFATISLNKGIPIEVVSSLLGHNNIQTTQVYTKIMDITKKEMMEKWNQ